MKKLIYQIGRLSEGEEIKLNFMDGLSRSVEERIKLGFIPMKLPVIDDEPYRIFNTMQEYQDWADKNLPEWLGYKKIKDD
jgi:hypothetical protein